MLHYTALYDVLFRVFPESPRWLVAHNKLEDAQAVLMKFGGKNKKDLDPNLLKTLLEGIGKTQLQVQHGEKKLSPIILCQTPKLRKWSIALAFNW